MVKRQLKSSRPHIGIFGRMNVGKSSIINSLAGQDVAIVSDHPGTTTDPVEKTMEIHGLGPVVIIDTAGIDDTSDIGSLRVERSMRVIDRIDCAVLAIADNEFGGHETELIRKLKDSSVPFLIVHNKSDAEAIRPELRMKLKECGGYGILEYCALEGNEAGTLIDSLRGIIPETVLARPTIIGDLVSYGDLVLLVTPIDIEAPEGRLILPQIQTIRDCLDHDCITVIVKERELDAYWKKVGIEPNLVVTDSQAFLKAASSTPLHVPMTSFSILFARLKGPFDRYLEGTPRISSLRDGDRVLILESCSHHAASDDIGRVKIPRWLGSFTGKNLSIDVAAGLDTPPRPMVEYSLAIQCGGCMITRKQILQRLKPAIDSGIPVTNYGMAIAYCLGIYNRAISPFVSGKSCLAEYI